MPPTASRSRKGRASGGFPTAEDVLKLALKHLQISDASRPHFAYCLQKVRKVMIVDITQQQEILRVTVECRSLRILEDLWKDYCNGHLSALVQNSLVTKDILKEFGLTNVKLRTAISEKEYKHCRVQFLQSLGEFESLFHLYMFSSYLPLNEYRRWRRARK